MSGQSQFAAALFDPQGTPTGLTTARGDADSARFAVYRNNVAVALIKALEGRFPVTRRIVGDGFFLALAHAFIAKHKPASPLIFEYGDILPDFIAGFVPARSLPYLPDVVQLEVAWTQAYHSADAPVLDLHTLTSVDLANCRLKAHPSTSIITSNYPVGTIWSANHLAEVHPTRLSGGETVLVARPFADVHVHILPSQDAMFAQRLIAGGTLGDAGQEALSRNEQFDFGTALLGLASLGAFTAIQSGGTE